MSMPWTLGVIDDGIDIELEYGVSLSSRRGRLRTIWLLCSFAWRLITCVVRLQRWTSSAGCQILEHVWQMLSRLFALDLEPCADTYISQCLRPDSYKPWITWLDSFHCRKRREREYQAQRDPRHSGDTLRTLNPGHSVDQGPNCPGNTPWDTPLDTSVFREIVGDNLSRLSGKKKEPEPKPQHFGPISSGGVVSTWKGWGPKNSVCPSKPRKSKFFGGTFGHFLFYFSARGKGKIW